jgi:hypothetical protein
VALETRAAPLFCSFFSKFLVENTARCELVFGDSYLLQPLSGILNA